MVDSIKPSSKKSYGIAFRTDDVKHSGYLTYTKITIETDVLGLDETTDVSLCDHPLYGDLEKYVHMNPTGNFSK